MKIVRILSLLLALLMVISVFAGCGKTPEETTAPKVNDSQEPDDPNAQIKDTVPTDLNYNGETITFLVREGGMNAYEISCEELLNNPVYDAIHYRNIDVETRLGLKIRSVAQPGTYDKGNEWSNTLSVSVLTNTGDFDGAAFYLSYGVALAKEGIYYDLLSLSKDMDGYFDFEKPWWNQTMVNELSTYGALFFAGGSLTLSQVAGGVCVFFNRDLFNETFPQDRDATLYQHVRDGKWTVDQMTYYVLNCWDDLNSNGVCDDGDIAGIRTLGSAAGQMDAWVVAMGLDFTKTNPYGEPEYAFLNSRTVPAYEKVRKLFNNESSIVVGGDVTVEETTLRNGKLLFLTQYLSYGSQMKASTVNYGVLPIPKYDEQQSDYRTCFVNSSSALAICSNLSEDRAAMVSAALELLSAESYKQVLPVYYGTVLKGHYSREQADAEMYDRILNSIVFSFGFAWSTSSLGGISKIFRQLHSEFDIQNHIDSNRDLWDQQLEDLLVALEDVV